VVLAVIAECCHWRSDIVKGRAEHLKRRIEFFDGLGWPIPSVELSDGIAKMSRRQRSRMERTADESYFASESEVGAQRLLENLRESSWWSKHLAGWMLVASSLISSTLLIGSLVALALSIAATTNSAALDSISRVVAALLTLILSLGLVKLIAGYFTFAKKSEQIENEAIGQLAKTLSDVEAIRILQEYQIARASAPLIPDWIWRMRRPLLNGLWINTYEAIKIVSVCSSSATYDPAYARGSNHFPPS
jgi:hypothetical protein